MTHPRMSKEREEQIRRYEPFAESNYVRDCLAELDAVRAELEYWQKCPNESWECAKEHARVVKERDEAREKLEIAREALELIDMRKEGFEEDLVECPKIAFEALAKLNEPDAQGEKSD